MSKYIVLLNWTDQGVRNVKDTVDRSREAAKVGERMGVTLEDIYWTSGGYDLVTVASAPDDETLAAFLLKLGGAGNLRSHTLRAFTQDDMTKIIGKLG